MINWIKSFFGKGYVRLRFIDDEGGVYKAKFDYVGEYNGRDMKQEFCKRMLEVHDIKVVHIEILGVFPQ